MAIFQSDLKETIKRLSNKEFGSLEERDQLLTQLRNAEGLRARDVIWMLFRPDRTLLRGAVVGAHGVCLRDRLVATRRVRRRNLPRWRAPDRLHASSRRRDDRRAETDARGPERKLRQQNRRIVSPSFCDLHRIDTRLVRL